MARCLSLALLGLVVAASAASPLPTFDLSQLFNRLTVPLGTVQVAD